MGAARYVWTWAALLLLLAATVAATFLPIGDWRQLANLAIAVVKAGLIAVMFMKLRSEPTPVALAFLAAATLLIVFAALLATDFALR